jgi:transglutaminase/protease-like cytokinesis protein 3
LIFNDGAKNFLVFDITWEGDKPVLALRYTINHGIGKIRQMNWDYAGNIICSGDEGIHIVSLPKEENVTVVPAKKSLTVSIPAATVAVTGVTLDVTELALEVPATATLTATVAPEDATVKAVVWASDNEAVATVAEGVVTAVAEGTANITVTTADGGFTATCIVTVTEVGSGVMDIQVLNPNAPMYDVLGRQVDKGYRGIVIQNGKTFMLK